MLDDVVATESLSGRAKLAFAAVLVVPLVTGVTLANTGAEDFAVDAEVVVLSDGMTVQSSFETNSCREPLRLKVDEAPREVRVRTLVRVEDTFGQSCTSMAISRRLTTTLNAPLGNRTLVAVPAGPR